MMLYGTEIDKCFIIASLHRTGSYLLCEVLESTGVVGSPTEPFGSDTTPDLIKEWCLSPNTKIDDFLPHVIHNCSGNRIFGFKIHWHTLDWLYQQSGKTIDVLFPNAYYIQLLRHDIRAQAISAYRAFHTGEWWKQRDVFNAQIIRPDPSYNSQAIRQWEQRFTVEYRGWQHYFNEREITPLVVEYEALEEDWRREARRCLTFLGEGCSSVDTAPEPILMRQADAVSRDWRRRLDEEDGKFARN